MDFVQISYMHHSHQFLRRVRSWAPRPSGSVVSALDSQADGCEFDPRLRRTFLSGIFSPLTSGEACEKSSRWLWKEKLCKYTCEEARKHMCITDHHDMTLAVKVALNPNTINQPTKLGFVELMVSKMANKMANVLMKFFDMQSFSPFLTEFVCIFV